MAEQESEHSHPVQSLEIPLESLSFADFTGTNSQQIMRPEESDQVGFHFSKIPNQEEVDMQFSSAFETECDGSDENYAATQILQLPSGEMIHLQEGENVIHLDENMNFVSFDDATQTQLEQEIIEPNEPVEQEVKLNGEPLKRNDELLKTFTCDLCPEAFEKKLQLNNHKDRRHGVKFVFTEKGKKVKLVRLPKDFEFRDGEKLDPCVQMLIKAVQHGTHEGAIGVQVVEDVDQANTPFHVLDQANSADKEVTDENWQSFECGFLVELITTEAYKKAKLREQTPFVAFYPEGADCTFLLRILPINPEQHLLVPATPQDVVKAKGTKVENVTYYHDGKQSGAGPSSEVTSKCKRDFKIPIVATVRQVYDEELALFVLVVDPPMKDNPVLKIQFLEAERFNGYARQCQGKKVRTLHEAANPMPPPKPRKPYQRRTVRSILKNIPSTEIKDEQVKVKQEANTDENIQETPLPPKPDKVLRSRRCLKKEFIDPDEIKDPSYEPTPAAKIPKKTTPTVIAVAEAGEAPVVVKRKRGRPRKVVPEGLEACPPKSQKRGPKKPKDLTELIQAVQNMLKTEKPSDDYEPVESTQD